MLSIGFLAGCVAVLAVSGYLLELFTKLFK
jgi:hypothetical protein